MALNIALVGYGKMGKLIEELAPSHGISVSARIRGTDNLTPDSLTLERLLGADVAVEFSKPDVAFGNLMRLAALKVPTVCGTTGWFEKLSEVREAYQKQNGTLIYGPNFSIGVNIFDRIVREAAKLFASTGDSINEYSAWGWEAHHEQKKDAPSGTLLKFAETMRQAGFGREINLSATRAGYIPGTHEIGFDSVADTITLRHTARSREGFAHGALKAAKWASEISEKGRKGVYEFSEILFDGR